MNLNGSANFFTEVWTRRQLTEANVTEATSTMGAEGPTMLSLCPSILIKLYTQNGGWITFSVHSSIPKESSSSAYMNSIAMWIPAACFNLGCDIYLKCVQY